MKKITEHPFTRQWWVQGAITAVMNLKKLGMLKACREYPDVLMMAVELSMWRSGLGKNCDQFYDDLEKDKNAKDLFAQIDRALTRLLEHAEGADHAEDLLLPNDAVLIKHAEKCTDPNCPIRAMVDVADKVAATGLKLGT